MTKPWVLEYSQLNQDSWSPKGTPTFPNVISSLSYLERALTSDDNYVESENRNSDARFSILYRSTNSQELLG